jgi:hypothetical protein
MDNDNMSIEIVQKIKSDAKYCRFNNFDEGEIYFCSMDGCPHINYLGRPCIFESRNPDIGDYRCPNDFNKVSIKKHILKLEETWKSKW